MRETRGKADGVCRSRVRCCGAMHARRRCSRDETEGGSGGGSGPSRQGGHAAARAGFLDGRHAGHVGRRRASSTMPTCVPRILRHQPAQPGCRERRRLLCDARRPLHPSARRTAARRVESMPRAAACASATSRPEPSRAARALRRLASPPVSAAAPAARKATRRRFHRRTVSPSKASPAPRPTQSVSPPSRRQPRQRGCICLSDGTMHCGSVHGWFTQIDGETTYN